MIKATKDTLQNFFVLCVVIEYEPFLSHVVPHQKKYQNKQYLALCRTRAWFLAQYRKYSFQKKWIIWGNKKGSKHSWWGLSFNNKQQRIVFEYFRKNDEIRKGSFIIVIRLSILYGKRTHIRSLNWEMCFYLFISISYSISVQFLESIQVPRTKI